MRRTMAVVVAVILLVACSTSSSHPPQAGDVSGGGAEGGTGATASTDLPPATTMGYTLEVGGSVPVSPGTKIGYALTASAEKTYRFRWTGDAAVKGDGYQHFYGSVWTTGKFTSITPGCDMQSCPLETSDIVSMPMDVTGGQRIDWDTIASTGFDGFSFTVDTEPVYFDVLIDSERHPELFFFPAAPDGTTATPAMTPFAITSVGGDGGASDAGTDADAH